MAKSFYSYIREEWNDPDEGDLGKVQWRRLQDWREQQAIVKIDRPTRLDKARSLGYKAKQGVVVVRTRVKRGSARKSRQTTGRRSKRTGTNRISRKKNKQLIAEERTSRKHQNLRVLNSYWVGEDGHHKWFEVIMIDPDHPAIENDPDLNWITDESQKGRVFRGKTSAAKEIRGLKNKGKDGDSQR